MQNSGRILHTLNPRLFIEQLAYIATEGEGVLLLVDADLVPLAEQLVARVRGFRAVVVLAAREQLPGWSGRAPLLCYEELLAAERLPANLFDYRWAGQDENARAALCFTSGTTGNPKVCPASLSVTTRADGLLRRVSRTPNALRSSTR